MSFEDVREFHEIFGHPVRTTGATADQSEISLDLLRLRLGLIAEEFFELLEASYGDEAAQAMAEAWKALPENQPDFKETPENSLKRDIVEIADALGDLKYVENGMALALGIPLPKVEEEIQRSNLSKLGEDGKPIISDGTDVYPLGKILKGPNYSEPDVASVLEANKISEN